MGSWPEQRERRELGEELVLVPRLLLSLERARTGGAPRRRPSRWGAKVAVALALRRLCLGPALAAAERGGSGEAAVDVF